MYSVSTYLIFSFPSSEPIYFTRYVPCCELLLDFYYIFFQEKFSVFMVKNKRTNAGCFACLGFNSQLGNVMLGVSVVFPFLIVQILVAVPIKFFDFYILAAVESCNQTQIVY